MRRRRRGIVRSAALRRGAFSLRSGISMGLRSGEYWGRYRSVASRASIASRRAAVRLAKALDPDNCGAGTNRKLLGRLAPRSSTFDLRNHSLPHLPRIGLRHRPASQKRINADRLSHPRPHENPPDSIGAEHALASERFRFIPRTLRPLFDRLIVRRSMRAVCDPRRSAMNEQVVAERRHSASDIVGVVLYSIVVLLVMLLWVYVPA